MSGNVVDSRTTIVLAGDVCLIAFLQGLLAPVIMTGDSSSVFVLCVFSIAVIPCVDTVSWKKDNILKEKKTNSYGISNVKNTLDT